MNKSRGQLIDRKAQILSEIEELTLSLSYQLDAKTTNELNTRRRKLGQECRKIDVRLAEIKDENRAKSGTGNVPPVLPRERIDKHILWCKAFVDCAKIALVQETWKHICKQASDRVAAMEAAQETPVILEANEKIVLNLLPDVGMKSRFQAIYDKALQITSLTKEEISSALEAMQERELVRNTGDEWMRLR